MITLVSTIILILAIAIILITNKAMNNINNDVERWRENYGNIETKSIESDEVKK